MVVVDSSVWIDYFNAKTTLQTEQLDRLLDGFGNLIQVPDIVLSEVLRGFSNERDYQNAKQLLAVFDVPALGGAAFAHAATQHYRTLRMMGITVRKLADVWIATYCIDNDIPLLHTDKDYAGFVQYRGLSNYEEFVL